METCWICMEPMVIPVRFHCFPCHTWRWESKDSFLLSCGRFSRQCWICAYRFLELDRPVWVRSSRKKCLSCDKICFPSDMTINKSLSIDITRVLSLVVQENWNCPFCSLLFLQGDRQERIMEHLCSQCPSLLLTCLCGSVYERRQEKDHRRHCPEFVECNSCHEFIEGSFFRCHMREQHGKWQCKDCFAFISRTDWIRHLWTQCPQQWDSCFICNSRIRRREMLSHIQHHFPISSST